MSHQLGTVCFLTGIYIVDGSLAVYPIYMQKLRVDMLPDGCDTIYNNIIPINLEKKKKKKKKKKKSFRD